MTFKNIFYGTLLYRYAKFHLYNGVKYLPIATILVVATIADFLWCPNAQTAFKEALKSGVLLTEVASGALSDYEAKSLNRCSIEVV
jgi:hypothetical protein